VIVEVNVNENGTMLRYVALFCAMLRYVALCQLPTQQNATSDSSQCYAVSVTKRNKTQHPPSALRKIEQHINHRAYIALNATLSATKRDITQQNATAPMLR